MLADASSCLRYLAESNWQEWFTLMPVINCYRRMQMQLPRSTSARTQTSRQRICEDRLYCLITRLLRSGFFESLQYGPCRELMRKRVMLPMWPSWSQTRVWYVAFASLTRLMMQRTLINAMVKHSSSRHSGEKKVIDWSMINELQSHDVEILVILMDMCQTGNLYTVASTFLYLCFQHIMMRIIITVIIM